MVINFAAGPAKLPREVLEEVQKNCVEYGDSQMSVMEMSHRGGDYAKIHDNAIASIRSLLNLPDNYKVILLQGGGTGVFASVCMNLMGRTGSADYIVTGSWSAKAAKEATKYGKVNQVFPKLSKFTTIPDESTWTVSSDASYMYYCDNETVDGVEFPFVPKSNGVPLVCDMSSNIFSRPFDIKQFGMIFGGAQKNFGPSGITVVVIREDLITTPMPFTPSVMSFKENIDANSLLNTPPTFIIYVIGQVFEWIKRQGGLNAMHSNALKRSELIYNEIKHSNGFYCCAVDLKCRSRMNVPFRVGGGGGNDGLEKEFLKGAEAKGMLQLKGHRSVGGIRASLYNALTVDEAETLVSYMRDFYVNNKASFEN